MHPRKLLRNLSLATFALASMAASRAVDAKLGLDRITPVPASEPVPVVDFFRLPLMARPVLNPSGTRVAAIISSNQDSLRLVSQDIGDKKFEILGAMPDRDIYAFNWLGDDRLLFSVSEDKLYGVGLYGAKVGQFDQAYPIIQYCGLSIVSLGVRDDHKPLIWMRDNFLANETSRDEGVASVYTSLDTGRIVMMTSRTSWSDIVDVRNDNDHHVANRYPALDRGITVRYQAGKDGDLAYGYAEKNGRITMYRLEKNAWLPCPVDMENVDVLGSGNEAGEVLAMDPGEDGKPSALRFLDPATGKFGAVVLRDPEYEFVGSVYRDRKSHEIVGVTIERNGPQVVWFSPAYQKLQDKLEKEFPHLAVRLMSGNRAGTLFLFRTYSDRQPSIFYYLDVAKAKIGVIRNSRPWIDPNRMRPMYPIKFKTRDGHRLDAYLTLPAGASKKNPPPLVVLPHGGPWARDVWGFDEEVQYLASLGYAVLQPNYRGSPGYDWMFPAGHLWDFAKMSDDVTDAVKMVIASGMVDSRRVAIMGTSFGGYLALKGVEDEPGLYRCAVAIDGVFDWKRLVGEYKSQRYDVPFYDRLVLKLGDPAKEPAKFKAISPLQHVEQVHVPVFVAHGKSDPLVDVSEAKSLLSQLEHYHVPHEDYLVQGEGHGMGYLSHRVELYTRIAAFLAANLGAAPASAVAAK